ncbi:glycosyltransferase family 61 protein [Methylobacterium mesophilicum]
MNSTETMRTDADEWYPFIGASSYRRRTPNLFNFACDQEDLRNWLLKAIAQDEINTPAQDLYIFRDAFVSDIAIIYKSHGEIVEQSKVDQASLHSMHHLETFCSNGIQHISGEAAFVFKAGKENYGHLLIEMLPKLEIVDKLAPNCDTLLVPTLPTALWQIVQDIVRTMYGTRFKLVRMESALVRVDKLVLPGPVTKHNWRKSDIVNTFVEKLVHTYADLSRISCGEKIYVSRARYSNRALINEAAIEDLFKERGFTVIYPEELSFADQISIFSKTKVIAGSMGAALTNLCFMAPNTSTIMIDNGMCDLFFYDLASIRQQNFNWIFTQKISRDSMLKLHESWLVDCDVVGNALRFAGY